ncbi:MAG: DNA polymerase Y family protein [Betaproteobacteria bacterium]|nr:DNA polymerase Y family protein [Betaproteobacteria bacterium]
MLWVALLIPELSLQLAQRAAESGLLLAVGDGPPGRAWVRSASAEARATGVQPGMTVAMARALVAQLQVRPRDAAAEALALEALAAWAGQFSPVVSIRPGEGLLLEVAGSRRLFGGLARLLGRLRDGLRTLGYRAVMGVAPRPLAAWWMARARLAGVADVRGCLDPMRLRQRLSVLPLAVLDWPEDALSLLAGLGVGDVGACLALPRDGLARRLGPQILSMLDRALGVEADPQPPFVAPQRFRSRLELPAEADNTAALAFPLRRLLGELEGFLRGRGAGVQRLAVDLAHVRGRRSRIELGLATPERQAARLLVLLQARLERFVLPAPAVALELRVEELQPYVAPQAALWPDASFNSRRRSELAEHLQARLGSDRVFVLQQADDHRPERAWARQPVDAPGGMRGGRPGGPEGGGAGQGARRQPSRRSSPCAPGRPCSPRPLWLLQRPRTLAGTAEAPQHRGALELVAGPERIESGWWDEAPVGRDYWVARNPRGELLWIYREHGPAARWYLHGIFG